ncbi:MAG TPA: DinB family protein [Pirellulales bacterium]|nr:DinB family protein [Pirellulales bacterium]
MAQKDRLKLWLDQSRKTSEGMLADFKTSDDWVYQVDPSANHAMWFIGHMTSTDNFVISKLAPERAVELPANYKELFGMGSHPVDDPAIYPTPDEALRLFRERRQALLAVLEKLSDEELSKPLAGGGPAFLTDNASMFELIVWHEGLHCGQMSVARRALGHAPLMGGAPPSPTKA